MGRFPPARALAFFTTLTLLAPLSLPVAAGDSLRKKVIELGQVTGTQPIQAHVKELTSRPKEAQELLTAGLALAKDKGLAYNGAFILAQVAQERKDLKACEVFFRVCMEEAGRLQSPARILESFGGLIDAFYDNKKFEESAKVCKELLELKTDDGKPRIVLYSITTRTGESDFIEDDNFDATKRLRPGVHRLLIQALAKQGKFEAALKLVDNLIKANDHWIQLQLRGVVLREAGKYAEAAKVYEDVLDKIGRDKNMSGEDKDEYSERYRYILSSVYVDLHQIDKATDQLQKLLEKKPDDPGYNNDLGYIWADHDMNLPEAEKLIRKALELDRKRRKVEAPEDIRDNGAYLDSLGWVLFKQKKYKEAKDALVKAVEDKKSQHIEIYDHLGDVCQAMGDTKAALDAWRHGLEVVTESRRDQDRKKLVEAKIEKHSKGN